MELFKKNNPKEFENCKISRVRYRYEEIAMGFKLVDSSLFFTNGSIECEIKFFSRTDRSKINIKNNKGSK